ncbi:MAG: methyltransferase [Gemmatimonadetes bacterium]|nr:methyltransferase [Gemmatimonadota bacterium]
MAIENVSDTARWVAVYRAMETARPDAIFRDPYAERLAGEKGQAIVDEMKSGRQMAWAMIVRTAVMDELIMERVKQHGVDTVLNLAAGLDTRAWRLPLPASLRWIDVDLPAMTEYKATHMQGAVPVCRYEAIAADLTNAAVRDALFSQVGGAATRMLVITEGLLIYLSPEEVQALARALHTMRSARWWISDVASPMLLKWIHKSWGKSAEAGNAPFKFGPADSAAFFGALGWREVRFLSQSDEARRLKREMKMMWLWRFMSRFMSAARREEGRRMAAIVLLERIDS